MTRLTLSIVLFLLAAGCSPQRTPPAEPEPAPPPDTVDVAEADPADERPTEPVEAEPADEPAEPADPAPMLYERTADEYRIAFSDALYTQYRREVDPDAARRITGAALTRWLDELEQVSPRSVGLVRQELGDVLDTGAAIGFVLPDANTADCARIDDLLFIAVPESMQGETRPYDGFIVRDACDVDPGRLCATCMGAAGTNDAGDYCSCVCVADRCPGTSCVSC